MFRYRVRDPNVLEHLSQFHCEDPRLWYDQYEKAYRVRERAAPQKGTRFLLTDTEFWRMVFRAAGRCEMTGQPFDRFYRCPTGKHPFIPTIDRIDSVGDYTAANCQMVTWISNVAVSDFGRASYSEMVRYAAE